MIAGLIRKLWKRLPLIHRREASVTATGDMATSVTTAGNASAPRVPKAVNPSDNGVVMDGPSACAAYLEYLQHSFGPGEMLWRNVYGMYGRLAAERGWPAMSEKALSQGLTALGCTSYQRDLRRHGKGRPRMLDWAPTHEIEDWQIAA